MTTDETAAIANFVGSAYRYFDDMPLGRAEEIVEAVIAALRQKDREWGYVTVPDRAPVRCTKADWEKHKAGQWP